MLSYQTPLTSQGIYLDALGFGPSDDSSDLLVVWLPVQSSDLIGNQTVQYIANHLTKNNLVTDQIIHFQIV